MILSGLHKFKNDLSDSIVFVNEDFELVVDGFIGYPRGRPTDSVSELAYRLTKTVSFSPGSRRIKFNALFFSYPGFLGRSCFSFYNVHKTPEWSFARSFAALILKTFHKKNTKLTLPPSRECTPYLAYK
jgi:hypothetical protein